MDLVTLALVLVAFFILFLMLTSGQRRHRLEEALKSLETDRMRLMKSIQHVRLSFFKKQLTEEEAQKKIFEYEEELRGTESKILQIREKPLMRTLNQQAQEEKEAEDVQKEEVEIAKTETFFLANMEAKSIILLFVVILICVAIALMVVSKNTSAKPSTGPIEIIKLPVEARAAPSGGTYPGGSAGLRVDITNDYGQALKGIKVFARAPEDSGIHFEEGEMALKVIPELEKDGKRELFFMVYVNQTTEEGEYQMNIEVSSDDGRVTATASAPLIVRVGKSENQV